MAPSRMTLVKGGSTIFDKLRHYYTKDAAHPPPLITTRTAIIITLLYTTLYIAPFYLSPTLRSTPLQSRDSPTVIRARIRAVNLTCLACTITTTSILILHAHLTPRETLHILGLYPINALDILRTLGLVLVLFTSTLYETLLIDASWRHWSFAALKETLYDSYPSHRTLIIAPATEELVFRSLTLPLFLLSHLAPVRIVLLTPLIFGLAHLHHLFDFLSSHTPAGRRFPSLPVALTGLARSLFQFTYTSLFGFFAAFVFLRTGSLWAVIAAHSLCNHFGVPRVWGRLGQFEDWTYPTTTSMTTTTPTNTTTPDIAHDKRNDDRGDKVDHYGLMQNEAEMDEAAWAKKRNFGVGWTVVYYLLMPVGAWGFSRLLWRWTESANALVEF